MNDVYVEKWVWTETDFEQMGWHDSWVYAIAFLPETFEFALDIDYIFKWVHPKPDETYFKFWVSPATLVFETVYDLKLNLDIDFGGGIEIADLNRIESRIIASGSHIGKNEWRWVIEAQEGEISFWATGYKQFIRKEPILGNSQALDLDVRGGVSFFRDRPVEPLLIDRLEDEIDLKAHHSRKDEETVSLDEVLSGLKKRKKR